jgi:hypothetical protein
MTTKQNKPIVITRVIKHDSLHFSALLPSGARLYWAINRGGEDLTLGFAADPVIAAKQLATVSLYLDKLTDTYAEKMDTLESLLTGCKSGIEVIHKMEIIIEQI